MKIIFLTTDNRDHLRTNGEMIPYFAAGHKSLQQGFATLPDVELHVISCTQRPMKSVEKLADNIWFHSLHVPKIGWLRTLYQGCIRAMRKKIHEISPDIVHGHGTERECSLSAALSGCPNVVTVHGNMAEMAKLHHARIGNYYWLTARLENFTLRRTFGVFCNSTYTENLVRPRARQTWLVPHALRMEFFKPIPTRDILAPVLLNVGVITSRKRQLELLDLAEKLRRKGLKFEFRFVGFFYSDTDPYVQAFLKRIKPMEAAGYVRFIGVVSDNELVAAYDSASAVVHFPTEEAFGNVVIEGLSRELKFFGSRLGGIVDIASDMPRAELFARDDWNGLADAIEKWIREGCPRANGAAELIHRRYHPRVIAQRHLEIYQEVLNNPS